MKILPVSSQQREVIQSNNSLRHYLTSLQEGRRATPHSWLFENEDALETLARWKTILKQLEGKSDMYDKIYQFDLKQESKFGQQGEVPPIREAIQVESFTEQFTPYRGPKLNDFRPLKQVLGYKAMDMYPYYAVVNDMRERDTLVTNSGWPAFTRREKVVNQVLPFLKADPLFGLKNALTYPAIILFRKYNGKLRAVWMYPLEMNLAEYRVTQPLQKTIMQHSKYVMPWKGFEDVKVRFTELWKQHPYAFGGDTTAMDAHMKLPQLNVIARALRGSWTAKTGDEWCSTTLRHVGDISILVGENAIIEQTHGIASGSGWTQLSETIFQILMFDEFIRTRNLKLTTDDGMGIGDDYVWFFDQRPDSEEIVAFWEERGLPGKPEKQSNEEDTCTFLQRLFLKGYMSREDKQVLGGVYPTIRALNSLLWPEKYHNPKDWNSDMFCIRCFMILENCVDHPLFEEFVRFVVKGQKDLLPFAKKSADELARIQQTSRLLPGLNPSYNQEKRDKPLGQFESIKYASTL